MQRTMINNLKEITAPFAYTWEHVQGPGGNTSVKEGDAMVIKASGFTFLNIVEETGLIWINYKKVIDDLATSYKNFTLECEPAEVQNSIPEGLRPSMEFEFHAILDKYVLHTHSIYLNVILCSAQCEELLHSIFPNTPFVLIPAVIPGHPLAASIYESMKKGNVAKVFFLKNHGVIIHGDSAESVLSLYRFLQEKIVTFLDIQIVNEKQARVDVSSGIIPFQEICTDNRQISVNAIVENILVPDQSIFFRNKVSDTDPAAEVYLDIKRKEIIINGSAKFMQAATAMLRMVYFILNNHKKLSLTSDFIPKNELQILHGLSSEKYRTSILKDK